jgi:hypothetical protein
MKLDELVNEWGDKGTKESLTRLSIEEQEIDEALLAALNEAEPASVLRTLIQHFGQYRDADESIEIAMIGLDEYALAVVSGSTPSRLIKSMAMAISGLAVPDNIEPFEFGTVLSAAWLGVLENMLKACDE